MIQRQLVVFDLDETLVHASTSKLSRPPDFTVPPYFIYQRPFLHNVLEKVAHEFDLAVWSSSSNAYVKAIVNEIFTGKYELRFSWSVERCVQRIDVRSNSYVYIKDLRKIQGQGFTLSDIIMVDDSPEKIIRQPRNHLPIAPYTGDANDCALLTLAEELTRLKRQ